MTWFEDNKTVVLGGAAVAGLAFLYIMQNTKAKAKAGPGLPAWSALLEKTFERSERMIDAVNKSVRNLLEMDDDDDVESVSAKRFEDLATQEVKSFVATNQDLFQQLFEAYDTNHDGNLSLEECTHLTRDSMIVVQCSLAQYVRKLVTLSFTQQKRLFKALSHDEDADGAGQESNTNQESAAIESEIALCIPIGNKIIAELIADTDAIAKTSFTAMDINADGKVSRQEFIEHFFALNQTQVGWKKFWTEIQAKRASQM